MNKEQVSNFAAVCVVRNECDIIELFIKINSRVFDKIFILDHNSSDGTVLIVEKLIGEGYPVELLKLGDIEFNQSKIITNIVREVAKGNNYDYIMPIDADEFLYSEDLLGIKNYLISNLQKNEYALVRWVTYCPVKPEYSNFDAPLFENFRARKIEPKQYYKVILGRDYAKTCTVSAGNHNSKNRKYKCKPRELNLLLQHVPIRSKEQLLRKSLIGFYTRSLRSNRKPGDSYHFTQMIDLVRSNNYQISFDTVYELAINYAVPSNSEISDRSLDESLPLIGTSKDTIKYKELSNINLTKDMDFFVCDLISKVKSSSGFKFKNFLFRLLLAQKQFLKYLYLKL